MQADKIAITLDANTCYSALKAHDPRFDGHFFVGVSSTGIYCRPVCRVKTPKEENCTFYSSAAAAEAAGYRPCLRCRPELAPGQAPIDCASALAQKAALLIEDNFIDDGNIEKLANFLNITSRHLRRVFTAEFGISPIQYMQTYKLLLAKSLLTDSTLSITDVAFAAGFGSVRRFNALFKKHYKLSPSALRLETKQSALGDFDNITIFLGYRPPYLWDKLLAFLEYRAIKGVEVVFDNSYNRTVEIMQDDKLYRGFITVKNVEKKNALSVSMSSSLLPVLPRVIARVKSLFDLRCDPAEIYEKLSAMNDIKEGLCTPGTRLPGSFDPFEMAVRAVLGQQISVKAARTLAARIVSTYGSELETTVPGLTHTFPTPEDICSLEDPIENHLGPLGVTGSRARSIKLLAAGIVNGEIDLSRNADAKTQIKRLLALPGFGPWMANYIAMRALLLPDVFLETDYGIKKALNSSNPKELLALSEPWKPWRSYATINLWNSL